MTAQKDVVSSVLDQMELQARRIRLALMAGAFVEGLLFVVAFLKVSWTNSTHVLLFIFSVLGYTIVVLGLMALAAHISRVGLRVVSALENRMPR